MAKAGEKSVSKKKVREDEKEAKRKAANRAMEQLLFRGKGCWEVKARRERG